MTEQLNRTELILLLKLKTHIIYEQGASLIAQLVKNPPAIQETSV